MPSELVEFFVKFLTEEGDLVFDPFGGSNTTGAVAEQLNRQWVSCEAQLQYVTSSLGRFDPTARRVVGGVDVSEAVPPQSQLPLETTGV